MGDAWACVAAGGQAGAGQIVERARALQAADPAFAEPFWFGAAMKLYDGREADAWLAIESALIGEPAPTLRAWRQDRAAALAAMLASKAADGEG